MLINSKELRIVYMGTPEFAVEPLKRLVEEGYNVVGVVTTPDKPSGRGLKVHESAVKQYAVSQGLLVLQPVKLKDEEFVAQFKALNADLGIVIAFRMLPEVIWDAPKLGTFNLHASLLPDYRGAAPINWAIINGGTKSGVTTFFLNHEIDKGDIIAQSEVEITPADNAGTLHDKLMWSGVELVTETINIIVSGKVKLTNQDKCSAEIKLAPKIFKEDCLIDWTKDVEVIHNHIRGLSPYPAAWGQMWEMGSDNLMQVKIYESSYEVDYELTHSSGEIVTDGRSSFKVACGNGYLTIEELQVAGKKRMSVGDFLRGFKGLESYSF